MKVQDTVYAQLTKIAQDNEQPENINAVLEINPDALFVAREMDMKPEAEHGALWGCTILLKDNINTADTTHTSAGSLALADHYAAEDAPIVQKLRAADAVILGKANMTEYANYLTEDMPAGYSSRGGIRAQSTQSERDSFRLQQWICRSGGSRLLYCGYWYRNQRFHHFSSPALRGRRH